jgi:hypothetical protein
MMNTKKEAILAIVAAFFVLFSAMFDARISAGLAIVCLLAFAVYKFAHQS